MFHVIINLYEGGDFFDVGNPGRGQRTADWYRTHRKHLENPSQYHLKIMRSSHKSGERVFRHIHINHGPDLEKAIDAVKRKSRKMKPSALNIPLVFLR